MLIAACRETFKSGNIRMNLTKLPSVRIHVCGYCIDVPVQQGKSCKSRRLFCICRQSYILHYTNTTRTKKWPFCAVSLAEGTVKRTRLEYSVCLSSSLSCYIRSGCEVVGHLVIIATHLLGHFGFLYMSYILL